MLANNSQRKGALSNTAVGLEFEKLVYSYFVKFVPDLENPFWMDIGHYRQKPHKFDLGCKEQQVIIEAKSHTWTEGGNTPSAKLTTWDQAMLYFYLAPRRYRKIFVVKHDFNSKKNESLLSYYLRTHYNVIPDEVEFWEINEIENNCYQLSFDPTIVGI